MAAGGAEAVAVDPAPPDDLDAVRSRREAEESGPGPEPGGGHVKGGGHDFVGRRGGGDGGQGLDHCQAVLVAATGLGAGGGPGGQGEGGAIGERVERLGCERPGVIRGAGHRQGGHDLPTMPDGDRDRGEVHGRIGAADGRSGAERLLRRVEQNGMRGPNCHNRSQLSL